MHFTNDSFTQNNYEGGSLFSEARREYNQETLERYDDLRPTKKRKLARPPWDFSNKRQKQIDDMTRELKYPSGWSVHVLFEHAGSMKTTEKLLMLGPVGAYLFSFGDCDEDFLKEIISLFTLLGTVMYKTSTPAERRRILREGAEHFTRLEMIMPISWNTFVRHNCSCHCCDTLESCGPFWCCNMLDHERMHTLLKSLARSKKDIFVSVANHYKFLEMALATRVAAEDGGYESAMKPRRSTPAGFAARPAGSLRADGELEISTIGGHKRLRLNHAEMALLQRLWRIAEPEYEALWTMFENHNRRRVDVMDDITEMLLRPPTQRLRITDEQRQMLKMPHRGRVRV